MKIKVVLCDDDILSVKFLKSILAKFESIEIVGEANNGEDCISLVRKLNPQILFCDIKMPTLNGIDTVRILREEYPKIHVIFISGFSEYALEAFDVHPYSYLIKPFEYTKVYNTVNRLLLKIRNLHEKDNCVDVGENLVLNYNNEINIVPQNDILFITRDNNATAIYTSKCKHITYESMDEIWTRLDRGIFMRSHKSYIINKKKVEKLIFNNKTSYKVFFQDYKNFAYIVSDKVRDIKNSMNFY